MEHFVRLTYSFDIVMCEGPWQSYHLIHHESIKLMITGSFKNTKRKTTLPTHQIFNYNYLVVYDVIMAYGRPRLWPAGLWHSAYNYMARRHACRGAKLQRSG